MYTSVNIEQLTQPVQWFSVTPTRAYQSDLREQQAERTRQLIAESARARFLDKGWAGTSVRSVAEASGVSEATVYSVYGSKAGLATSLIDAAEQGADVHRALTELRERAGDPGAQLRAFVDFDRRLFELGGDVIRILSEGRRQHPELGAAYDEGRARGNSQRRKVFESWPARTWQRHMHADRAIAVYAVLVSLDSFDTATCEHGWSPDEVEAWWHSTLAQQFFR